MTTIAATTDAGLDALLNEYAGLRNLIREKVRARFPVGLRVAVLSRYGGRSGVVDGHHGSEVDAVWVQLDVPTGHESRRALVLAVDLVAANWK